MKKISQKITIILVSMSIFAMTLSGCGKTTPLNYDQPKDYAYVLDSYLPGGYEITSEWRRDSANSFRGTTGNTSYRRYKIYWACYADANDRLNPEEADEAVVMDSIHIEANGGDSYREKAMVESIREALEDNVRRLIDQEVKTTYYKYGTQIIHVDFAVSDEDILNNTYQIDLANMTWEDVQNLKATIHCTNVHTSSDPDAIEEKTEAMEQFKETIEAVSGVVVTYALEQS